MKPLDGSNPKEGTRYEGQFAVDNNGCRLLVYARAGEASRSGDFQIPGTGIEDPIIDDSKPACIADNKRVSLDSTDKVFSVLNKFRDRENVRLKGVRVEIGEGENTVSVRFAERRGTSAIIANAIDSLRSLPVKNRASKTGYYRRTSGSGTSDSADAAPEYRSERKTGRAGI